ncbi:MAG: gamma-glutamylcyclotransferase family protein [Pseudonocardiaceae bacterium]
MSPAPAGRLDRFLPLGSTSLFTYGTLLFPEVLRALLGRVPQSQPVSATGWRVAALENRSYPGLVAARGEIAHGRLLIGLSGDEWHLLDDFEDRRYELRRIALSGGRDGLTYVWVDDAEACPNAWDAQSFVLTYLPAYVERCAARHTRRVSAAPTAPHSPAVLPRST